MGLSSQDIFNNTEPTIVGEHIRTSVDPTITSSITPTILSNATITTDPAPATGDVSLLVDGFNIAQANNLSDSLGISFNEVLNKNLIFNNDGSTIEITFDLGDKFLVNSITINSLLDISANIAYVPKAVSILASDDGINFDIPLTNITNTGLGTQKALITFNTIFKRYFKILITEINYFTIVESLDTSKLAINEIQFEYKRELQISTNIYVNQDFFQHPTEVDLREGWNLIGYPHPYKGDVIKQLNAWFFGDANQTLYDIKDYLEIFKNNAADVYWPEFNFNGIDFLKPGEGYQMRLKQIPPNNRWRIFNDGYEGLNDQQFLSLYGSLEKYTNALSTLTRELKPAWNIISYNRYDERNVIDELTSVDGYGINLSKIDIIKNNSAEIFWPQYNFNNIGNFIPGQGYQIRMAEETTSNVFGPLIILENLNIPLYLGSNTQLAEDLFSIGTNQP